MNQFNHTRDAEDGILTGEVVPADEQDDENTDESDTSSQAAYPQTYLHKVASGRSSADTAEDPETSAANGYSGEAADPLTGEQDELTGEQDEEQVLSDDRDGPTPGEYEAGEAATAGPDSLTATDEHDVPAASIPATEAGDRATGADIPATDTGDRATGADIPATDAEDRTTEAGDREAEQSALVPAPGVPGTGSTSDVSAAATEPDLIPAGAISADEQRGRHRADEPTAADPVSDAAGPGGRRPGDEPIPQELDESLLPDGNGIREQWLQTQARFVDDPRVAVSEAATIITDVVSRLEAAVRDRQEVLRARWDGNSQADTEALRVTMQQYRHLLERLADI